MSEAKQTNYDPADPDKMNLPVGKTCGDCVHIARCKAIFGHTEADTSCDWSPSRFVSKVSETASIADCGEYGHDKGVCGNAQCLRYSATKYVDLPEAA